MPLSRSMLIAALMLAACGGSKGNSGDPSGESGDAGVPRDAGGSTGLATGTCSVDGAAKGTFNVRAVCSNSGPDGYVFTVVTDPVGADPGVSGNFWFGADAPTANKTYTLNDCAVGNQATFFGYIDSSASAIWMAGNLSTQNMTGSIELTPRTCETQSHGTLKATLKSAGTPGEVTVSCSF